MANHRATLSARVVLPEARIPTEPRRVLLAGTTGTDIDEPGLRIRAGALPLFRRGAGNALEQCVRLRLDSAAPLPPRRFALEAEGRVLDETTAAVDAGQGHVDLFLPEVEGPETVEVAVGERRVVLAVEPQRKWRIHVVHHSHLDLGYTDPRAAVLRNHCAYLDAAVDLADLTADWPPEARFRWTIESNYPLQHWLRSRPGTLHARLFDHARTGTIDVGALPFTSHTQMLSVDELAWQLGFAVRLREEQGLPVDGAMQTDVPGAVLGLPDVLAAAGVRFLAVAHNWAGRAAPYLTGGAALPRLFRWRGPAGGDVLVWHTDSPHGVAYLEGNLLGLADTGELAEELLPEYLAALAVHGYPYGPLESLGLPPEPPERAPYPHALLHVRVQGTIADNAAPSLRPAEIARAWNERWAYPQLVSSTNRAFFVEAERTISEIETHGGDWGDWWADGVASGARAVGTARRAQSTLQTVQTLAALAGDFDDTVRDEVDAVYELLSLFDEHTWSAAHPEGDTLEGRFSGVLQSHAKSQLAFDAEDRSLDLLERTTRRATAWPGAGGLATVAVFNPTATGRTDIARVFVPASRVAPDVAFAVVDAESRERIPFAVEERTPAAERNRPPGRLVSLLASAVPPLGYRRYELVADATAVVDEPPAFLEVDVLESERYVVRVDPTTGALASIVDRRLGRELVDTGSPFGFGSYLYDRYTGAGRSTMRLAPGLVPSYAEAGASSGWVVESRRAPRHGAVLARRRTAVEDVLSVRLEAPGADGLETTVRLPRAVARVELEHRLHKRATREKEGGFFTFPFALPDPVVHIELTAGVDTPGATRVPGSATHVRAIRRYVAIEGQDAIVGWSAREAALLHVGNVHLPFPPYPESVDGSAPGLLVSAPIGNVWDTNFPLAQGGELVFAYAIASAPPASSAAAVGLAAADGHHRPLVAWLGDGTGAGAPNGSFCSVDRPDVEVVRIAPSSAGHDLAVLLRSHAQAPVEAAVAFPDIGVERAWAASALEQLPVDLGAPPVRVALAPAACVALLLDVRR